MRIKFQVPGASGWQRRARLMACTVFPFICVPVSRAVTETWDGGGSNDFVSTAANWLDNTAPVSSLTATDLIFTGPSASPNFTTDFSARSVTFNSAASSFQLGGTELTVGSGGIANNSTQTQEFGVSVSLGSFI